MRMGWVSAAAHSCAALAFLEGAIDQDTYRRDRLEASDCHDVSRGWSGKPASSEGLLGGPKHFRNQDPYRPSDVEQQERRSTTAFEKVGRLTSLRQASFHGPCGGSVGARTIWLTVEIGCLDKSAQ